MIPEVSKDRCGLVGLFKDLLNDQPPAVVLPLRAGRKGGVGSGVGRLLPGPSLREPPGNLRLGQFHPLPPPSDLVSPGNTRRRLNQGANHIKDNGANAAEQLCCLRIKRRNWHENLLWTLPEKA